MKQWHTDEVMLQSLKGLLNQIEAQGGTVFGVTAVSRRDYVLVTWYRVV